MPFRGGPKAAAEILARMPKSNQDSILKVIEGKDRPLADFLRKNLVSLDDLGSLTEKMLVELLREVKVEDMGLALRLAQVSTREHILGHVSSRLRQELSGFLQGPPQAVSKVQECEDRVMSVVRKKVEKGELVLKDSEEMV